MQTNQQLLQEFIDHLKFHKRYSQHTIVSYQTDLTTFFDFLAMEYGEITSVVSASMIRGWLASLKENEQASKTINRKISTLKSFYKFLLRKEIISVSPMAAIVSLKVSKRLPSYIEQKDMQTLFNHVEFPDTWDGKTERLLLEIFYQTGIRLSELINLKQSQIDKSNSTIKVLGKGNKERIIPINNDLATKIFQYISEKTTSAINPGPPELLISGKGKKLAPRHVYNVVKHYLSLVTTNEKKSPHVLRHTFATHLTGNGADINAIKELLGHSSLAATQVYTSNTIEKLKDIHKKAHPKA
ncbi:tyrosine recombinase XerC [soil metagenome]